MDKIILRGITWDHTRGFTPLVAAAQRFSELNPHVEMVWSKRTLQEFADKPIEALTHEYDLLVIDHPWVGCAAATRCVLPLDKYLPAGYLNDQSENTVGPSHASYIYGGHQWALAMDAATPAASYRADLFSDSNVSVPLTWEEVLDFARSGRVLVPGIPVDALMAFYMFCHAYGHEPFANPATMIDEEIGLLALNSMRKLWSLCDPVIFKSNPIAVAEMMSSANDYWYCPFAYCYSNYSRRGFAKYVLTYDNLPQFDSRQNFRSTIGGTGLAISATSDYKETAIQFAQWVCSGECQSSFYVENGGQPGHRLAWINKQANILCNNFFVNLLPVMENGWVRPRYNGYLHFQDHAAQVLWNYLYRGGDGIECLKSMDSIYQGSLKLTQ